MVGRATGPESTEETGQPGGEKVSLMSAKTDIERQER